MKVNFVVRRTKKNSDGYVPIEMTICVKGKRQYVSTGRSVMPSKFSPKTQTVKGDKELNEFLKAMTGRWMKTCGVWSSGQSRSGNK